jgi:hypothetical protein
MVTLEATERCIIKGYAQYNPGDRAVFSDEEALNLLEQFPNGWRECHREDAKLKAPSAPPTHKMVKTPERKK